MGRLVYRHKEFIVIEDDYRAGEHIIINTRGAYENHCHVKRLKTAKILVKLMKKKKKRYRKIDKYGGFNAREVSGQYISYTDGEGIALGGLKYTKRKR